MSSIKHRWAIEEQCKERIMSHMSMINYHRRRIRIYEDRLKELEDE